MDFDQIARDVIEEARRQAGSGLALARELERLGIGPEDGGSYSESTVSNWINGRNRPLARIVFAAAALTGTSLDARLAGQPDDDSGAGRTLITRRLAEVQTKIQHLDERLGRLEGAQVLRRGK